jgi:LAO/AO transport system kinase
MNGPLHRRMLEAKAGDARALARLITAIEDGAPGVLDVLDALEPIDPVHVLGVTGPPGSGKSTLTDRLVGAARARGERVAVLLVDPSSPFSGGAVLGDRIRMQHHTADPDVFIRSLGSRGHQGGLTRATEQVLQLVRSAPFDRVIVETVGVGQTELQVMDHADTVLVVLVPEAGDAVQAMKAGLTEIAHVFAVNKADRPGADRLVLELEQAVRMELGLQAAAPGWQVEVVAVSALHGDGLDSLYDVLARHGEHVRAHPPARREPRDRLARLLSDEIGRRLAKRIGGAQSGALEALLSELDAGRVSVFKAAAQVLTDAELLAELVAPGEDTR